jgi:hypothetical protein
MKIDRCCEDCGDEMLTRRTRCLRCGLLVCTWCYSHVHAIGPLLACAKVDDGKRLKP